MMNVLVVSSKGVYLPRISLTGNVRLLSSNLNGKEMYFLESRILLIRILVTRILVIHLFVWCHNMHDGVMSYSVRQHSLLLIQLH